MKLISLAVFLPLLNSARALSGTESVSTLERRALATVYSSCNAPNTVALTFDDGPWIYENDITSLLTQNGIKGTFFVNGNNYDCIYNAPRMSSLQNAYNNGMEIGSHTWAHLDLTTLSWDDIHDQMWRVELAMSRILGVTPAMMRPPYGNYNDEVRSAASIRNQSLIMWDFDSGDSTGSTVQQSEQLYDQLISQHPNNILALNHETYETTAHQLIPYAIQQLKAAGYNFATVSECLGISPYASVGAPGTPDSTSGKSQSPYLT